MIFILNLGIMFAFVYFAARGVKATIHHIKLMKYVYSNAHLRSQVEELQIQKSPKHKKENVIYLVKDQPKVKRITSVRK